MGESADAAAIIQAVVRLGQAMGLAVSAELVSVIPLATFAPTLRIRVKVADADDTSVAMLQLPELGVQLNDGPDVCASETNIVPAGIASLRVTLCASLGPLFVTVIV